MLVIDRKTSQVCESSIAKVGDYLQPGDMLVLNETYVHPARLHAHKAETGAKIELLLLSRHESQTWIAMAQRTSRLRPGTRLIIGPKLEAEILRIIGDGNVEIRFDFEGQWDDVLAEYGHVPLPPYIRRGDSNGPGNQEIEDRERYQTVFAKNDGLKPSAAAPTAGLHLTRELLNKLEKRGITIGYVRLQIGRDTFLPIRVDDLSEHEMHTEWYKMPQETADRINTIRSQGGRVIAVGTTAVRVLESSANEDGLAAAGEGQTSLFIYPGYRFRCVDAMLTNFHLPKSTLIVLVAAFCGHELQRRAYQEAIEKEFRFYSYGDAMLIT